jgi:radical SAM-linked protein
MAPDVTPAAPPPAKGGERPADAAGSQPKDRVRLRFRKLGALRLLSHHDLMRTFERMLRRAGLPFHRSQGFHPKPRLVFALSLPLGVAGLDEVADLELDEILPPEEIHERLRRQAPPGLEVIGVRRLPLRGGVRVRGLSYAVEVPPERTQGLRPRIDEVLAATTCWIDRTRPPRRRLDLRPFLRDLRLDEERTEGRVRWRLVMDLWLLPSGTARPEEILQLLNLQDLLESGAVLERTRLELDDDEPPPALGATEPAEGRPEPEKVTHEERNAD